MSRIRLLAVLLLFALFTSSVQAAQVNVNVEFKTATAIDFLFKNGLIDSQEKFIETEFLNRAEFLKIVLKYAGYDVTVIKRKIFKTPFRDVPSQAWFAPYVFEAYEKGLIKGGDYFNPGKPITRLEALQWFFAVSGLPVALYSEKKSAFEDVPKNSRIAAMVNTALNLKLIQAQKKDTFGLLRKMTKGETARMIYQFDRYKNTLGQKQVIEISTSTDTGLEKLPNTDILMDVWDKLHQEYLFPDKIDDEKMVYGAIDGMVTSLDDPFTVFMPPEEGANFTDSLEGELEGIGAYVGLDHNKIIIISPIQGSPAQEVGLKPNDQILKVNNESVEGLTLQEVVKKIKGPAGTEVELLILRGEEEKVFKITRAKIDVKSVAVKMEGNIAVISLNQFLARSGIEFDEALQGLNLTQTKGIILDLRNNPGGYLNVAVDLLGHFIAKDQVVVKVAYPQAVTESKSKGEGELKGIPLIILVNEGSASAAEIVAGALQDYKIAKLLGAKTYGKGTVQELVSYRGGSSLKITIAKWLTPLDRWIDHTGLEPDIAVTEIDNNQTDEQMDRALQELR